MKVIDECNEWLEQINPMFTKESLQTKFQQLLIDLYDASCFLRKDLVPSVPIRLIGELPAPDTLFDVLIKT